MLDFLRRLQCDYCLGLPTNATLARMAEPWLEQCKMRWKPALTRVRRFHQFLYGAGSWSHNEKVIARVEATALGTDVRFVMQGVLRHDVTNLPGRAKVLYEKVYCARGRMKNLIKDMKLYTRSDKTACTRRGAARLRHDGRAISSACSCTSWRSRAAHGRRLLAAAFGAARSAKEIALARRDVRDHPQRVRENCVSRRGAENAHQAVVSGEPAARRRPRPDHRPARHAIHVSDAAGRAAGAPSSNPKRMPEHPRKKRSVHPAGEARLLMIGCDQISYGE